MYKLSNFFKYLLSLIGFTAHVKNFGIATLNVILFISWGTLKADCHSLFSVFFFGLHLYTYD